MAANWIMGDIAAYLKNEQLAINEIKLTPKELAELIASIQNGTISGKIGKEILVEVISHGGTVKSIIEEKDLVQVEIKNMNSFSAMSRAIDYEISRQILGQSDQIVQKTQLWEEGGQV